MDERGTAVTGEIGGRVARGFEPVAEAFAGNFANLGELGAAFAVTLDGRPVVDLWGGVADSSCDRPWQEDTMQLIFSGTKGLTALCMAMLIDRGLVELDDPVCLHWPQFAAKGKEAVTVAEVVSHRGRLPAVRTPVSIEEILDGSRMATLLADQPQERDPRAAFIYHRLTYGWLCGEIVRRVDGRSLGRFFAEEVAAPLGLELWIGLPSALEERVARLQYGPEWGKSVFGGFDSDPFEGDELWASIWRNPLLYPDGDLPWNLPALHAAQMPGANAIGTARSIARLYGALARGGELDGVRIISAETLELARVPLASGAHPYTKDQMAFGAGFQLQTDPVPFGPPADAFGHDGMGGSVHCAWPTERVGLSYAMNELRDDLDGDPRPHALLEALHGCLSDAAHGADDGGGR
ncbi:MAG TPA: serine hydrolase domain-containing protein [Solirubrobacteraceae bacterium]|jgi:CubicO group peptidase (beta-lactamase class C family)|nr:serine hydrolase domain-containing protein [Solirubrobacteraceae bacterium]